MELNDKIIINSPKYGIFEVLIDKNDFKELNQFTWHIRKHRNTFYAQRPLRVNGKRTTIQMHRAVLGLSTNSGFIIDHKNHNGIDNRKENLRIVTITQNNQNSTSRKNSISKHLGVRWHKANKKWTATIVVNKKSTFLGCFLEEIEAAKAYNEAAKKYFGEFANLNIVN